MDIIKESLPSFGTSFNNKKKKKKPLTFTSLKIIEAKLEKPQNLNQTKPTNKHYYNAVPINAFISVLERLILFCVSFHSYFVSSVLP